MSLTTPAFSHDYKPGAIHFGRNCIANVEQVLSDRNLKRALVVCGRNVGSNPEVIEPVRDGLGTRFAGLYDETSPAKTVESVFDGIDLANEVDADVIVAVGSGSSLDVGAGISALAKADRAYDDVYSEVISSNSLTLPDGDERFLPLVKVPTTMAGADLTVAAGVVAATDDGPVEALLLDDRLMPMDLFYDPELYETTPDDILAASAINGFDKGVEAIYSKFANPMTDSTAVRGLKYLRSSLPDLRNTEDPEVMERAVMGIVLVQQGLSMPEAYKISIVHAFGHALRNQFGIQQGTAHAIIVPHALRLIFEEGGGRPNVLAKGLVTGEEDARDTEEAVIEAVTTIRDSLGLPSHLRDAEGTSEAELGEAAEHVAEDNFLDLGPESFEPSVDDIEATLRDAW